jgi:hypothetical protein
VSVYAMHNDNGGGGTLLGTATADSSGGWVFATAQSGRAMHFAATATDVAGNVSASSVTINMMVTRTTDSPPLGEPSPTNGGHDTGIGHIPALHGNSHWWSAIHDHHANAVSGANSPHGWHDVDAPAPQKEQLFSGVTDLGWGGVGNPDAHMANGGISEHLDNNALPLASGQSAPKEHFFSGVTDQGWVGLGISEAPIVNSGAFLEHDRVASFDAAHASHGGAFLL